MKDYGDGCLYKRGDIWWMKFYRDGRPISKSCKTKSEDMAKTKLRAEMRKRDDELTEPRFTRVSIGDLVRNLLAFYEATGKDRFYKDTKARWEQHLAPVFEHQKAVRFGTADQHKYRAKRIGEGASNTTINRELQIVRRSFRLGADAEPPLVKRVPKFIITREENARMGFLNRTQVESLKRAAAHHSLGMRALVEAAHILGWRRGNLLRAKVKDVNLQATPPTIFAGRSKNGSPLYDALTSTLRTYLEALVVGKQPDDLLFGIDYDSFQKPWDKVRAAAGLPDILFHDLRRTSARSKREAGIPQSVIMEMHGWKTDAMFRRYGIVDIVDKAAALSKLEQLEDGYNLATLPPPVSGSN